MAGRRRPAFEWPAAKRYGHFGQGNVTLKIARRGNSSRDQNFATCRFETVTPLNLRFRCRNSGQPKTYIDFNACLNRSGAGILLDILELPTLTHFAK